MKAHTILIQLPNPCFFLHSLLSCLHVLYYTIQTEPYKQKVIYSGIYVSLRSLRIRLSQICKGANAKGMLLNLHAETAALPENPVGNILAISTRAP